MHIPAFTLLYGGSHEGFSAPLKQSSRSADVASYGAVRIPDFLAGELRDSSCRRGTKGTRATVFSGEPWPGASARPLSGKGARVDCLFLPRRSVVSRGGQNPPHALRRNRPCFPAGGRGPSPWSGEFPDRAEGPMAAGATFVRGGRISKPLSGNRHGLRPHGSRRFSRR